MSQTSLPKNPRKQWDNQKMTIFESNKLIFVTEKFEVFLLKNCVIQ